MSRLVDSWEENSQQPYVCEPAGVSGSVWTFCRKETSLNPTRCHTLDIPSLCLVTKPTEVSNLRLLIHIKIKFNKWNCNLSDKTCGRARFARVTMAYKSERHRLLFIYSFIHLLVNDTLRGSVAQSENDWATGWTVRNRIPVGTKFSARPDRPWGPPSLLYNGYRVFPGGKVRPTHPLLVPRSWKSRAIPLPTLWATPGLWRDRFTFNLVILCSSGLIWQSVWEIVSVFLRGRKCSLSKNFSKPTQHCTMSGTESYCRSCKKKKKPSEKVWRYQLSLNGSEKHFAVCHS